jgi:biotin carboxyl carrier protein
LVPLARLKQLQRDQARLQGERGQLIADIARSRGKISETELQILQLDQDFRTDVLKELRETQAKVAELQERANAAADELKRTDIRAPQAGIVYQLQVHTIGGVIGKGETVMQIAPRADPLIIEAKVAPQDIDQVEVGAPVRIASVPAIGERCPILRVRWRWCHPTVRETALDRWQTKIHCIARVALSKAHIKRSAICGWWQGCRLRSTSGQDAARLSAQPLRGQSRTFRER